MPKQLIDEEKFKKIQKDLTEIHYKIENASEIERRVTRIFKEVDINGMVKQIKQKANNEETKKEMMVLDSKYS